MNGSGAGPWVTAGTAVVVGSPVPPGTVTAVKVGSGQIRVSFTAPANSNGSAVSGYAARCESADGGTARQVNATVGPIVVTGLSVGKTYRCKAAARNGRGWSDWTALTALPAITA